MSKVTRINIAKEKETWLNDDGVYTIQQEGTSILITHTNSNYEWITDKEVLDVFLGDDAVIMLLTDKVKIHSEDDTEYKLIALNELALNALIVDSVGESKIKDLNHAISVGVSCIVKFGHGVVDNTKCVFEPTDRSGPVISKVELYKGSYTVEANNDKLKLFQPPLIPIVLDSEVTLHIAGHGVELTLDAEVSICADDISFVVHIGNEAALESTIDYGFEFGEYHGCEGIAELFGETKRVKVGDTLLIVIVDGLLTAVQQSPKD